MEKGKLIEFRINGERRLAVVDRPEGKKDWIVIDSEGSSYKLRQQKIEYEVIGGPYIDSLILEFIDFLAATRVLKYKLCPTRIS